MAHNFNELIKSALENKDFYLVYQPVVAVSQQVIGYEAFLRWQPGAMDDLPVSIFWELLEVSDEIAPLNDWFFEQLINDYRQSTALRGKKLFVNLSFSQIMDGSLQPKLTKLKAHMDIKQLIFDVSETTLMSHVDLIQKTMHNLVKEGVQFALDDLGAGYSSLNNLKILPLSYLKIDNDFTSKIDSSDIDLAIVKACVQLAKAIGLQAIAEGVENQAQFELLKSLGIDYAQGYFFGYPDKLPPVL